MNNGEAKKTRDYELVCLLNIEGNNKSKYESLLEKLKRIIGQFKVEKSRDREGRELKHCSIKNFANGIYYTFNFSADSNQLSEFKKELGIQGKNKEFLNRYTLLNLINIKKIRLPIERNQKKEKETEDNQKTDNVQ